MHALFADHVVLQRDRPIPIWGNAAPGEDVTVTLSGSTKTVRADAKGRWSVQMPDLPAGGPHTLTARTATRLQNADDVLVGDVWLCSGQSNMEWSVRASLNSRAEINASADDGIRHVRIPRVSSITVREGFDAPLEWKVASPETTGDFSAVCYFYARELAKSVNAGVPQGLVVSAWGGSKIEPWMSADAIRKLGGYEDALAIAEKYSATESQAAEQWGEAWKKWWLSQAVTKKSQPWTAARGDAAAWRAAPAELKAWEDWGVPELARFDGMVWFRARVALSAAQAKQQASLSLGQIDEVDLTFVNGRAVGSSPCCGERNYKLPAGVLKAGENLVVVNALDTYASGGMYGPAEKRVLQLADGTRLPLGTWEYQIAPGSLSPPRAPWEPTAGVATLYNGMIAPLGHYGFRGALWYQGESNSSVVEGRRYQAQLAGLMADWRRQFDTPLPFLVVQLANYGALATSPVDSGWALTRDAQRRAVAADGNAGLVVTTDIGNRDDVHPTNKQEVGRRLARAARHVIYGEKLSATGAQPKSARRVDGGVEVTLAGYDGELRVIGSRDPAGFELCGNTQESCRFVRAALQEGGSVRLEDAAAASATRVRFCWADSPLCNLYDTAGLPVGPFEIELDGLSPGG
jgi:sialate O-acetylesterase